jgi:5'(3')-deoxyribonucleotidase
MKAAVGADLYIDDSPRNIADLRAENHDTIIFTNSTNQHLERLRADSWNDVEKIVLENFPNGHEALLNMFWLVARA